MIRATKKSSTTTSEPQKNSSHHPVIASIPVLRRVGWTDETFVPGQVVTIKGNPARREDNVCSVDTITLADGTEIGRNTHTVDVEDITAVVIPTGW